jgi:predicted ATPase
MSAAHFIRGVRVEDPRRDSSHPFGIPVIRALANGDALHLNPGTTFFVGENGSGKSTLIEALAVAAGFNAEGGSQNFRFETRSAHSELSKHLTLIRGGVKPRTGFFLRAESYFNVATEIERLDEDPGQPGLIQAAYGGTSPHEQSHGESFLNLIVHRFGPHGLYLLDEPEAALSFRGCLAAMSRIAELTSQNCQFLIATHSPVLLALPGATILEIGANGALAEVGYDDVGVVRLTRDFLTAPGKFLRYLV